MEGELQVSFLIPLFSSSSSRGKDFRNNENVQVLYLSSVAVIPHSLTAGSITETLFVLVSSSLR